MTEKNFEKEQPKKEELLSEKEYIARGKRLYRLISEVISNQYTYNPEKEKELLELKEIFANLYQARVQSAKEAEWDLEKKNLLDFDPLEKIREAQQEYKQSQMTPKDDEKRIAKVYFALPDWATTKATEAYELIQTRGLNRPPTPTTPKGARLFPSPPDRIPPSGNININDSAPSKPPKNNHESFSKN